MIVNINGCVSDVDETSHVLKFSAIVKQVEVAPVVSKINNGRAAPTTATSAAPNNNVLTLRELLHTCGSLSIYLVYFIEISELQQANMAMSEKISELTDYLTETQEYV